MCVCVCVCGGGGGGGGQSGVASGNYLRPPFLPMYIKRPLRLMLYSTLVYFSRLGILASSVSK